MENKYSDKTNDFVELLYQLLQGYFKWRKKRIQLSVFYIRSRTVMANDLEKHRLIMFSCHKVLKIKQNEVVL